ncbi:MAG: hypothetical protein ACYDCC_12610 [Actinomycetota bacterium]
MTDAGWADCWTRFRQLESQGAAQLVAELPDQSFAEPLSHKNKIYKALKVFGLSLVAPFIWEVIAYLKNGGSAEGGSGILFLVGLIVWSFLLERHSRRGKALAVTFFVAVIAGVAVVGLREAPPQVNPLEQTFGHLSAADLSGFMKYDGLMGEWNSEGAIYVAAAKDQSVTVDAFKIVATSAQSKYESLINQMRSLASSSENSELRLLLTQLTDLYGQRLQGVEKITQGITSHNASLIDQGNALVQDAAAKGLPLLRDKFGPLFTANGLDFNAFMQQLGAPSQTPT